MRRRLTGDRTGRARRVAPIATGMLLVALGTMLAPVRSTGATSPEVRKQLRLIDQALRLRVGRDDLPATQADAELQRRAAELASRESAGGRDPALLAEHRREAAAFFAHIKQAIRSASRWPSDQPPEKYETQAIGQLERARGDYREALREGKDPRDALRLAQQVLAWTRGEKEVPGDRDLFAGEEARVTAALQAGPAAPPPTTGPPTTGPPPPVPPAVGAGADPGPPTTGPPPAVPPAVGAGADPGPPTTGPPPPVPPAVGARADPGPPTTGPPPRPPVKGREPSVVAVPPTSPPTSPPPTPPAAAAGGAATAPENSPTYVPNDEAIEFRRKADDALGEGDLETALREHEEALKIEPRYAPWWSVLGDTLGEHGRWQEAEAAFRRAVELNPDEPEYRVGLALALLRLGRREEAIKHAQAARAMAREQENELHETHPVYQELDVPEDSSEDSPPSR